METERMKGVEDVYSLLYTGQPVYDWERGEVLGKIKSVSWVRGRLECQVEFRGGNVVRYDEHSLHATPQGIIILPPGMRETNESLYELGSIWKRISELDDLLYTGMIPEDRHSEEVAELLVKSKPLEERIRKDREEFMGVKERLDKEKKIVHDGTLELQIRYLLKEISDADRDERLDKLRKRNSFLNARLQVFEDVLKRIRKVQTFIHTRTRTDTWSREGVTGIVIKGTRESEEESR